MSRSGRFLCVATAALVLCPSVPLPPPGLGPRAAIPPPYRRCGWIEVPSAKR